MMHCNELSLDSRLTIEKNLQKECLELKIISYIIEQFSQIIYVLEILEVKIN